MDRILNALIDNCFYYWEFDNSLTCMHCNGGRSTNPDEFEHDANCVVVDAKSKLDHIMWVKNEVNQAIEYIDSLDSAEFEALLIK